MFNNDLLKIKISEKNLIAYVGEEVDFEIYSEENEVEFFDEYEVNISKKTMDMLDAELNNLNDDLGMDLGYDYEVKFLKI